MKHAQDLHAENQKMLVKDMKKDLNKWEDIQ